MNLLFIITVLFSLILPPVSSKTAHDGRIAKPHTRTANAAAERAWRTFFPRFRNAVKRRDRAALRNMMSPEFLYSFGGDLDRDQALASWDESGDEAWRAFAAVLARGAVSRENADTEGRQIPSRIAPPAAKRNGYISWRAYFEYGADGRWRCTAFVQGD